MSSVHPGDCFRSPAMKSKGGRADPGGYSSGMCQGEALKLLASSLGSRALPFHAVLCLFFKLPAIPGTQTGKPREGGDQKEGGCLCWPLYQGWAGCNLISLTSGSAVPTNSTTTDTARLLAPC